MKRIALLLASLTVLAAACGAEPGPGPATTTTTAVAAGEQLSDLAAAQDLWLDAAPIDYTITHVDYSSAAEEPSTVAVREGEVVSLMSDAAAVDEVFVTIENSIRDGADVDVEYDPRYGYPVRIVIDHDGDGIPDTHLEYGDLEMMPIVKTVEELQAAERRWLAQELDSYRYIFRFDCTCPESGTFEVDVRDGLVTDVRPLDDAARNTSISPGVDIDAAFDDLEEWFVSSGALIEQGILAVDVRMDPRYGYPRWFRIEGEDVDGQTFEGRFTMVVTIDLIAELDPIDPTTGLNTDDLAAVEAAVALWDGAGLADYGYVIETHCECPAEVAGPFEVKVVDGAIDSVAWLTGEDASGVEVASIEDTFELIGLAVAGGTEVEVIYDHLYGFPEFAVIDPNAVAVDGGLAFSIAEFEVFD